MESPPHPNPLPRKRGRGSPFRKAFSLRPADLWRRVDAGGKGGARGFDFDWIRKLCLFATQNLEPDLTLYLDIDPHLGLSRVARSKDRIEREGITFHEKIRAAYLSIAKKEPKRFHVLDGSQTPDDVFQHAMRLLQPYWQSQGQREPLPPISK